MRISNILEKKRPIFSFEFFPPKTQRAEAQLMETLWDLSRLQPDFVSVTYGAGGSTRELTIDLVGRIKKELNIETMAHLTCVDSSIGDIRAISEKLESKGIENILGLRGDPPQGEKEFKPHPKGFKYASELIGFLKGTGKFCIGGACYPEGHPESKSLEEDILNLKKKVDAGAEFLITQLFFDNIDFFAFVERARRKGITVPIIPGIMPVTSFKQIERFTTMCGARIPAELKKRLEKVGEDPLRVPTIGVEWAVEQCKELLKAGVSGIHFYTLNHSPATRAVFEQVREA